MSNRCFCSVSKGSESNVKIKIKIFSKTNPHSANYTTFNKCSICRPSKYHTKYVALHRCEAG